MSSFFIKHPTIAIVISIVMILLGGLALLGLPIEQYPNIVPPTIKMQATYPGANAETVANSVASPAGTVHFRRGGHGLHDFHERQQRHLLPEHRL